MGAGWEKGSGCIYALDKCNRTPFPSVCLGTFPRPSRALATASARSASRSLRAPWLRASDATMVHSVSVSEALRFPAFTETASSRSSKSPNRRAVCARMDDPPKAARSRSVNSNSTFGGPIFRFRNVHLRVNLWETQFSHAIAVAMGTFRDSGKSLSGSQDFYAGVLPTPLLVVYICPVKPQSKWAMLKPKTISTRFFAFLAFSLAIPITVLAEAKCTVDGLEREGSSKRRLAIRVDDAWNYHYANQSEVKFLETAKRKLCLAWEAPPDMEFQIVYVSTRYTDDQPLSLHRNRRLLPNSDHPILPGHWFRLFAVVDEPHGAFQDFHRRRPHNDETFKWSALSEWHHTALWDFFGDPNRSFRLVFRHSLI